MLGGFPAKTDKKAPTDGRRRRDMRHKVPLVTTAVPGVDKWTPETPHNDGRMEISTCIHLLSKWR